MADEPKDYEVGYRKPPVATRFRKGQSGNPQGRARGTRNLKTDLLDELAERILIKENGKAIKLSKQRALLKSLAAKALKGDTRAATLLLNMMWRVLEKEPPTPLSEEISAEDEAILTGFLRRQLHHREREGKHE